MAEDQAVALRAMTMADLPLVRAWLTEPHVARWYLTGSTVEAELSDLRRCVAGSEHTHVLIVVIDGHDVGWCQWYRCGDYPDHGAGVGAEPADAGIDYAIGDPRYVCRGLGTALIAALVAHVRRLHPGAGVIADPEAANVASRRVLEKNGFTLRSERTVSSEPTDATMAIYRLPAGSDTATSSQGTMSTVPGFSAPDALSALLQARSALLADVDPDTGVGERLLVRSDLSGTMQLHELRAGELVELTALSEPVSGAHYIPRTRRAVLQIDEGGNERHQLYLLELDDAAQGPVASFDRLENLTGEPGYGHEFAGVAHDGRSLAYVSNRGNGVDFDLWLYDLAAAEHRCLYASSAWCQPGSGFSPDDRFVSVLRPGERPLDIDLVLVDTTTGETRVVLGHRDEPALVGAPAWVGANTFYVSSNVGTDFAGIVRYELTTGTGTPLEGVDAGVDAEVVASANGQAVAVIENRGGASAIRLYSGADGTPGAEVALPEPGVVSSYAVPPPLFSADGRRLYFTLSTPRLAGDVFAFDADTTSRRLTTSPAGVAPESLAAAEVTDVPSFDGERIPLFVFRPRTGTEAAPVVVVVHGGPEGQAVLSFDPVIQGLAGAGYAVVVPNVRGSTGYGKRYAALDDTTKRLDSVRDLSAVHGALEGLGCDRARAILWGGSYGGYMVLAGLAFQPELWAAGVDIVGISDLMTFLENTSEYRRAHREREYGSLEHDRDFLAAASPLRHADAIRAPLFAIHGRNDPRVPVSEAEQLVANLRGRGVRCELAIYEDEGHGLARLPNRLDAYPRAVAFLDGVLGR